MSPEQIEFLDRCFVTDPQPFYVSPLDTMDDTADELLRMRFIERTPEQSIGGQWYIGYRLTLEGERFLRKGSASGA